VNDETKNTHMPVRPAATIALLRDGPAGPEVLLLRRSTRHVFAASMYVYPGGGVEEADGAGQLLDRYASGDRDRAQAQLAESDALAYWAAATRECFEEAGVLVGCSAGQPLHRETLATARDELNAGVISWHDLVTRMELRFSAADLTYFAFWTTPPGQPRRFSTRFFAARMPAHQTAHADGSETTRGAWLRPATALARHDAGDIGLMRPTLITLQQLAEYADVDAALADMATRPIVAEPQEGR